MPGQVIIFLISSRDSVRQKKGDSIMKSRFLSVVFCVLFLVVAFLPGLQKQVCGEVKEEKTAGEEKSREMATPKEASFKEKKEEYKQTAKEKLARIEKKIDELEVEAKKAGSKVKGNAKKGLKELKQKREVLRKDIVKLEAAGKKKWEAVKKKVDVGMDDLEKTYDKVRDYFKSE
jgi:hypothetical protein